MVSNKKLQLIKIRVLSVAGLLAFVALFTTSSVAAQHLTYFSAAATPQPAQSSSFNVDTPNTSSHRYYCGSDNTSKGYNKVYMSIDIGCKHQGSAIADATFAILRFLSAGVGLVITGSLVFAGIQYSASRGDPQATALAIKRIQANVVALIVFIFAYAILDYIIPSGFLQ